MRFRPKIDEHDYNFKMKHVREFLESGSKVRAFVLFRGREMTRLEYGRKILERLEQDLADIATVDSAAKMEGRSMSLVVSPRSEVVKRAQEAKSSKAAEKERDKHPDDEVELMDDLDRDDDDLDDDDLDDLDLDDLDLEDTNIEIEEEN
jgi:translation initiation factor IF-3